MGQKSKVDKNGWQVTQKGGIPIPLGPSSNNYNAGHNTTNQPRKSLKGGKKLDCSGNVRFKEQWAASSLGFFIVPTYPGQRAVGAANQSHQQAWTKKWFKRSPFPLGEGLD